MLMVFLFPFANFFQPGVAWPDLADYKPLQLIAIAAVLFSLGRQATYSRMDALRHPATKFLLFYLFIQVISVYAAGLSEMLSELGIWSTYALFVLVSLRIITSPDAMRRYVWGMMLGSLCIIVYGIYGVFAGILQANGGRAGAYGMYENHNDYTFIIIQTLPFYYVYWRNETRRLVRWFLLLATLVSIAGVFLSLSRGGMMALVLEILLFVVFTMKPRTRLFMLPLVVALGAGAITYQYIARAANQGNDYTADDAENSRLELWTAGAAMVKAHPLLGVGSRSFGEHATMYAEISHDNLGKNAHNTFIEVVATSGLLGFVAFVGMLVSAIRSLHQPVADIASDWERNTRVATLIGLYTICLRAMFDAKTLDWSFYVLVTLAVASAAMMKARRANPPALPVPADAVPLEPAARPATNHLRP